MKMENLTFTRRVASRVFNSSALKIGNNLTSEPFFIGRSSFALSATNSAARKSRRQVYVCKDILVTSLNLERYIIAIIKDVTENKP
jgi:hypothetical protein